MGGTDSRPLFVGEAPSPSTARHGGHPLVGETGARLARWAGLSRTDFYLRCAVANLFDEVPDPWHPVRAVERARALLRALPPGQPLVLLGQQVAAAFGEYNLPPFTRRHRPDRAWVALLPHPSGLNHYWNDPAHVARAERFLRQVLHVTAPRARQARLPIRTRVPQEVAHE